jgi:hypothetical protein
VRPPKKSAGERPSPPEAATHTKTRASKATATQAPPIHMRLSCGRLMLKNSLTPAGWAGYRAPWGFAPHRLSPSLAKARVGFRTLS